MLAADPANALTRKDLAYTHKKIADLLVELTNDGQALAHFRQALENYLKVVADAPADLISQFLVAACHGGVARMQARLGDPHPALEECGKAHHLLQEITADKTPNMGRAGASCGGDWLRPWGAIPLATPLEPGRAVGGCCASGLGAACCC